MGFFIAFDWKTQLWYVIPETLRRSWLDWIGGKDLDVPTWALQIASFDQVIFPSFKVRTDGE